MGPRFLGGLMSLSRGSRLHGCLQIVMGPGAGHGDAANKRAHQPPGECPCGASWVSGSPWRRTIAGTRLRRAWPGRTARTSRTLRPSTSPIAPRRWPEHRGGNCEHAARALQRPPPLTRHPVPVPASQVPAPREDVPTIWPRAAGSVGAGSIHDRNSSRSDHISSSVHCPGGGSF